MKLTLKPVAVPFMVGDTIWINRPYGDSNDPPYFQAKIIQIILDGSLSNTSVIRQRQHTHELVISSAIYDLKPLGDHEGLPRMIIQVQLLPTDSCLFETQEALLTYRNQLA